MLNRLKAILADFFQQADLVLLGLCCTATVYGIMMIYSATRYSNSNRPVIVQSVALLLGICVYIFLSMVDIEIVMKKWKWMVGINIVLIGLLLTPLGIGGETTGNQAWLQIPGIPFNIGPAEVVKITFSLLLAKQLAWQREEKRDLRSFRSAAMAAGHTLVLMGWYVAISGDMGNALTFFFIFLCMAFAAGFALRWFVLLFAGCGAGVAVAWMLDLIPSYMKNRFLVLFDHSYDVQRAGWQQTRSILAIGSGGVFGQGYLQGIQTQSTSEGALPARHTDEIFAVCGEELGMVGCLAVILLLAAIILRCVWVARRANSPMSAYIAMGYAAMLLLQTGINIGMCLYVFPVVGLTLPFFSSGGSSIITLYACMGIVSGIKMRSLPSWLRDRNQLGA